MKHALKFAAKLALLWFVVAGFCAVATAIVAALVAWSMGLPAIHAWPLYVVGAIIGAMIGTGITWQLMRGRFGVQ